METNREALMDTSRPAQPARRRRAMTVGELSRRTGVTVKALREYTDLGLICTLGRSPANYRLYDTDALWCVRFIGELRGLGLTVAEIRRLTTTGADGTGRMVGSHLAELLRRSRERMRQRIAAQQQILDRIEKFEAEHQTDLAEGDLRRPGDPHGCDRRT
ncbi:MerR family transcriptional regulator [Streptomyces sp. B-S-A8]|uniref:MerR family transcriptional regulator n=1 Tax=Streptomyces solicavernae TaxID=3043614 RepID=A0ABT6RXH0_9ACTN|nr:MerR family transcriptional regulator [Streptomyces sp. B-S-A8]MDI3389127.1 MerR family transcriptional regulator [Streptomyces sp. B-S-A8]